MYVLDQHKGTYYEGRRQRENFIFSTLQTEEKEELGRGMAGKEQVLCNEICFAIEKIGNRVDQGV
jgi:hypothetical protein